MSRAKDDSGQVGGIEVLPFGLLIFVVGTLLVTNAWGVIDAKLAVTASAREATRAFVESGPTLTEAERAAAFAGREALEGHGRDPRRLTLAPLDEPAEYRRCERVTYQATYPVPAIVLPWAGGFGHAFTVRARHSEIIDPFRGGLSGVVDCG
jgi:hypothetical protein